MPSRTQAQQSTLTLPNEEQEAAPPTDEPLFTVEPHVPQDVLDGLLGTEVTATIRVEVDSSGVVTRATAIRSSHPRVRQYLVDAVRLWRYPAATSTRQLEIHLRLAV